MSQPVLTDEQLAQPVTVIYFKKESGNAMKRLATRIRDNSVQTRLIWAHVFLGPDDVNHQARAVIVEHDAANRAKIVECYERYAHNVEIHYVDQDGKFVELSEDAASGGGSDTTLPGAGPDPVDPQEAIANLKQEEQVDPEPDSEEVEDPDGSEAADEVSSEDSESES